MNEIGGAIQWVHNPVVLITPWKVALLFSNKPCVFNQRYKCSDDLFLRFFIHESDQIVNAFFNDILIGKVLDLAFDKMPRFDAR